MGLPFYVLLVFYQEPLRIPFGSIVDNRQLLCPLVCAYMTFINAWTSPFHSENVLPAISSVRGGMSVIARDTHLSLWAFPLGFRTPMPRNSSQCLDSGRDGWVTELHSQHNLRLHERLKAKCYLCLGLQEHRYADTVAPQSQCICIWRRVTVVCKFTLWLRLCLQSNRANLVSLLSANNT